MPVDTQLLMVHFQHQQFEPTLSKLCGWHAKIFKASHLLLFQRFLIPHFPIDPIAPHTHFRNNHGNRWSGVTTAWQEKSRKESCLSFNLVSVYPEITKIASLIKNPARVVDMD